MSDKPFVESNPAASKWKIAKLSKITGERNGSRHSAFVFVRDVNGNRLAPALLPKVSWTWRDIQPGQVPKPPSPKQHPDPYDYDIPLEKFIWASIWVDEPRQASDVARNVTAMLPDEDQWNTWGHHSWEIEFRWVNATTKPPEVVPVVPPTPTLPNARYVMPFKNARSAITQYFGENPQDYAEFNLKGHNGLDFACPVGTEISVVADGEVAWVDWDKAYGNYVRVYHPQSKLFSFYAHLDVATVKIGDVVKAGQVIARSGNTGNSDGPHLHLEFRLAQDKDRYEGFVSPFGHRAQIDPFPLLVRG